MEIYLVGGAVRDQLLGRPVTERDWIVVGATPEEMLAQGFQPVGKDFPVFLHPKTHEEYALARTERKTGKGYTGFSCYAAPDVTLTDDLKRRDLTINAMAQTEEGSIIDPYGGQADLQNRILRHVSPAFAEDPVRILRLARFAARFPDFKVHSDTLALAKKMVREGEVNALVAERVWQEWQRALNEPAPWRFFEVLENCNALAILFPQWNFNDSIKQALNKPAEPIIKFAILFYATDLNVLKKIIQAYRVPKDYAELAILVNTYREKYNAVQKLSAEEIITLLEKLDAFRRQARFEQFLLACEICEPTQAKELTLMWHNFFQIAQSVPIEPILKLNLQGKAIAQALHTQRVVAISTLIKRHTSSN
jgi:tRNA nucleotidyltransferase (CCA-adding enzyme)